MTSIDIIECSRSNAVGGTNSNWTNVYASPVEVGMGDIIQVKNCFVDTNAVNSSNIQLDEDVNIELKLGYYIINNHQPDADDYKTFHNGAGVDYQPYIARKENFEPHLKTFTYTLPKGSYTASDLAQTLTRQFTRVEFKAPIPTSLNCVKSGNVFLINTRDINDTNLAMRFYEQKATRNEYILGTSKYFTFNRTHDKADPVPHTTHPCWNIGASQVALLWNKNLDGRFQFEFLHTPVIEGGQMAVLFRRNDANTHYDMMNRRTGVFFTEMKPTSFWEQLGFNVTAGDAESMIVSFDANNDIDTDLDVSQGKRTTGGFIGLNNVMFNPPTGADDEASLDCNWFSVNLTRTNHTQTSDTYNIVSSRNYDPQQDGGYWLLSVSNFHNEFHEDTKTRHDIQALIPRNYIQNNFITAYQESGISWVNRGEPFLLSSVNIQILEPKTKVPVSNSNLGENNAIFLQIIHSPPKIKL